MRIKRSYFHSIGVWLREDIRK